MNMIKLSRAEHVMRSELPGQDFKRQLELQGIDDLTCTAFMHAKVQATHGPRATAGDSLFMLGQVFLREPERFSYPRILEYIESKPAMTFLAWCLSMQVLSPSHVFSALAAHQAHVDRHDLLEILGVVVDYYDKTASA